MTALKALPTTYRGVTFRSRLEADWASSLDGIDMPWTYEPEGYQLSDGSWYAPDFWLPTARAWLEVKGGHERRVTKVEQFAADLWAESGTDHTYNPDAPMILIARAPARNHREDDGYRLPPPLGVMGSGKGYSAMWVWCPACRSATAVALWQPACRNCGAVPYEDPLDWASWETSRMNVLRGGFYPYMAKWRPVPRPFGKAVPQRSLHTRPRDPDTAALLKQWLGGSE